MEPDPSNPDLRAERRGEALWLTITREARRNAMNDAVLRGIAAGIDRAESDPGIRVVVITGAGEKAFCAGADLQSGTPFGADFSQPYGPRPSCSGARAGRRCR